MTDKPIRIQLRRTKGWKMPPNTVKVARPSRWGNPAKIGDDLSYYIEGATHASAKDVVAIFRCYMEAGAAADPEEFEAYLAPLRGKNLACFCPLDQPCHADVLLDLANPKGGA